MNTEPDDPLARAVAAGRERLRAMMDRPPAARPRPVTRKSYLAELEADVAAARERGYSDAEIARALSLEADMLKALSLDLGELSVTERALRRGGDTTKVAESASLRAKKQQVRSGTGSGRRTADPAAAKTKATPTVAEPAGTDRARAPTLERTASGPAPDRAVARIPTPGPMLDHPAATDAKTVEKPTQMPPQVPKSTAVSAAAAARDLFAAAPGSPTQLGDLPMSELGKLARAVNRHVGVEDAEVVSGSVPSDPPPF